MSGANKKIEMLQKINLTGRTGGNYVGKKRFFNRKTGLIAINRLKFQTRGFSPVKDSKHMMRNVYSLLPLGEGGRDSGRMRWLLAPPKATNPSFQPL